MRKRQIAPTTCAFFAGLLNGLTGSCALHHNMKNIKTLWSAILLYLFVGFCSSENFQPVTVSLNYTFTNVTIWVCSTDAICNDTFIETFYYNTTLTSAVAYLSSFDSTYAGAYYYSAFLDGNYTNWVFNRTKGYLGRGNITVDDLPVAIVSAGDTTHVSTSGQIYNFVTGQGYLTSESDPVFTGSAAAGIGSGDISNWNDAYGWGDHSIEGYLKSESDPQVGTMVADKWCIANSAGTLINCTENTPAYDDTALWANATGQELRLIQLQGNITIAIYNLSLLWTNASDQQESIRLLWSNASNQDGRIVNLEGRPLQPSIDAANVTTGTMLNARMNDTWLITTSDCSAGEYLMWPSSCVTIPAQPNIDASNITSGTILNVRYNMSYLSDVSNASAQETHIRNLWSNASNQDGRIVVLEGYSHASQPNIDGYNITSGIVLNSRYNNSFLVNYSLESCIALTGSAELCDGDDSSGDTGALQPSIDAANITSGTILNARINTTYTITSDECSADNMYVWTTGCTPYLFGTMESDNWCYYDGTDIQCTVDQLSLPLGMTPMINMTALQRNMTEIWGNVSQLSSNQSNLWTNASNQDGRIIALEGYNHASQPNIDSANITSGTILDARINNTRWVNYSQEGCIALTGSAGLCDGSDDGVGGGADRFSDYAWLAQPWITSNKTIQNGNVNVSGVLQVGAGAIRINGSDPAKNIYKYDYSFLVIPNVTATNYSTTTLCFGEDCRTTWPFSSAAEKPNIDGHNITSGTIPNARYNNSFLVNYTNEACIALTGSAGLCDGADAEGSYDDAWISGNFTGVNVNITALQVNVTDLWTNATGQQGSLNSLWTNASNQDGRIISLESYNHAYQPNIDGANITSGTIDNGRLDSLYYINISFLYLNATEQYNRILQLQGNMTQIITNYSSNDSNQDGRIVALESYNHALQPSIDGANITSGTILNARYNGTYLLDKPTAASTYVNYSSCQVGNYWTYTSGCTTVQAMQPTIDAANITSGTISNARLDSGYYTNITFLFGNATEQFNRLVHIQGNVSLLATNQSTLWTNISNHQNQLWQKNSTCYWIRFP